MLFFLILHFGAVEPQSTSASKSLHAYRIKSSKAAQSIRLISLCSANKQPINVAFGKDGAPDNFKGCFAVNTWRWEGEDSRCWIVMYPCTRCQKKQSWRRPAQTLSCRWWAVYYEFRAYISRIDSDVFICLLEPLINMKETRFQIRLRACGIIELSPS